jgi:hypothetical protein
MMAAASSSSEVHERLIIRVGDFAGFVFEVQVA